MKQKQIFLRLLPPSAGCQKQTAWPNNRAVLENVKPIPRGHYPTEELRGPRLKGPFLYPTTGNGYTPSHKKTGELSGRVRLGGLKTWSSSSVVYWLLETGFSVWSWLSWNAICKKALVFNPASFITVLFPGCRKLPKLVIPVRKMGSIWCSWHICQELRTLVRT